MRTQNDRDPADPEIEDDLDNPEYYQDDWVHGDEEEQDEPIGLYEQFELDLNKALEEQELEE